jgi:predicted ATPase with chaperone activity
MQLSARGIHRVLRVARSIADLAGADQVDEGAILAAATLRDPAAHVGPRLAA